jgi:alkanesulfonate monooxygenase SsuD/methylene tetrahydromethanopterin reductase-like flavin-dependent oxidoreductase (luciferase family)
VRQQARAAARRQRARAAHLDRAAPPPSIANALIVPPNEQSLKIWLGSGGSLESAARAVEVGLPLFLGILGGTRNTGRIPAAASTVLGALWRRVVLAPCAV